MDQNAKKVLINRMDDTKTKTYQLCQKHWITWSSAQALQAIKDNACLYGWLQNTSAKLGINMGCLDISAMAQRIDPLELREEQALCYMMYGLLGYKLSLVQYQMDAEIKKQAQLDKVPEKVLQQWQNECAIACEDQVQALRLIYKDIFSKVIVTLPSMPSDEVLMQQVHWAQRHIQSANEKECLEQEASMGVQVVVPKMRL